MVLFALVTWQVAAGGPLLALDERLGLAWSGHGPPLLTALLADLGNPEVALPVLVLALGYAARRGDRARLCAAALATAAVPAVVVPLKLLLDRPGPLTAGTGYYPSGHTVTAAVAYGAAALLLAPYAGRRWPLLAGAVLASATGAGLVLHGYHWPLDVVGGWCLSGVLLLPLVLLTRPRPAPDGPPPRASTAPGDRGR